LIKYPIYYWLLLVIIGGLFGTVTGGFFAVIIGGFFIKNTHLGQKISGWQLDNHSEFMKKFPVQDTSCCTTQPR